MSTTVFERRYVLKPERGASFDSRAGATLWDTFTF